MFSKLFCVCFIVASVSCKKQELSKDTTNNKEFQVELLFTHEMCNVFRFYDAGRHQYYVRCKDAAAEAINNLQEGKSSTIERIPTVK